jgi:hypothetical protein
VSLSMTSRITVAVLLSAALVCAASTACGGDDEATTTFPFPSVLSATPSAAPDNPVEARQALDQFVAALAADDLQAAWALYAASIPGEPPRHQQGLGCEFVAFNDEFPRMKVLFRRLAPFETVESFPIEGRATVEMRVRGQDGVVYLATLKRVEPYERYRLVFFNSGQTSRVLGAPDPLPSPDEPRGFCGIWTGGR